MTCNDFVVWTWRMFSDIKLGCCPVHFNLICDHFLRDDCQLRCIVVNSAMYAQLQLRLQICSIIVCATQDLI